MGSRQPLSSAVRVCFSIVSDVMDSMSYSAPNFYSDNLRDFRTPTKTISLIMCMNMITDLHCIGFGILA